MVIIVAVHPTSGRGASECVGVGAVQLEIDVEQVVGAAPGVRDVVIEAEAGGQRREPPVVDHLVRHTAVRAEAAENAVSRVCKELVAVRLSNVH